VNAPSLNLGGERGGTSALAQMAVALRRRDRATGRRGANRIAQNIVDFDCGLQISTAIQSEI
jgi:hypothetical protein